jgi:CotS family spore coat protein
MGVDYMVRETEISMQYQVKIYEMIPMKGVYLLKTDKGNKCLKKINYNSQKLMYLYYAKEHIKNNGFNRIDKYFLTPSGSPYALVNEDIYIMTDWIEGRECDFKKEEELSFAASALAEFHNCARGFVPEESLKMRNDIGKLPSTLEKRLITLNKMRDIARKNKKKTNFDILYLSNVDFYINNAKNSIKQLDINCYGRVCQEAFDDRVLCHHDYTYHNILFDLNNDVNIVDFDYCKEEIQIYDISTLIVKALKRLDWCEDKAKLIIDSYNMVKQISKDEFNVLKAFLIFPQRFWRLSNRYYYREAGWSEATFDKKMKEIITERENYMNFISKLDEIFVI